MSFAEIVECVKQLTLEEKVQLQSVVAEDINGGDGLPPGWFTPGMIAYPGTHITTDQAGFDMILEASGMKVAE